MTRILTSLLIGGSLLAAAPALAESYRGFDAEITAPVAASAVKLDVVIGDDLAYRANNLPRDLKDRGHTRSLNDGFGGNGFYGEKDLNELAERLEEKMAERLTKEGLTVDENATTTLRLTLTDAKPSRPTFEQMSRNPSLSFKSFARGGASFEGEILSEGQSLGTMTYGWYENDIRDAAYGGTWQDAHRAIGFFSKKAVNAIQ